MTEKPEGPKLTADDVIIDMEMASLGMVEGGHVGYLEGDEARKLVEHLFEDEGGLPEEIKSFFEFPEEE